MPSAEKMAGCFTDLLGDLLSSEIGQEPFTIALSGGSTPKRIFESISLHHSKAIDWTRILFFWVDERCVSPDDNESNYKMARQSLFVQLEIPEENVFRMMGENDPEQEAFRYSTIVSGKVPVKGLLPQFDLILLGLGIDGHVASIFPGNNRSFHSVQIAGVVSHPQSGQKRVTLTGSVINNAKNVIFLVTGKEKAEMVARVIENDINGDLPASQVNPLDGNLIWLLDTDAAGRLKGDHYRFGQGWLINGRNTAGTREENRNCSV